MCIRDSFGKPVLPVLVADGINLNLLPPPINEIQVTDYRRRDKDAAFALIKSISTAPGAPPLPDPLPTPPKVPVSYLSTLKERIDAPGPLTAQDQIALVFDLEVAVREGRSAAEMRDLLLSLRRRDDLLAKVGSRIDETLKAVEAKAPSAVASRPRRVEEPTLCHQCRKVVDAGAKFCGNCGASIAAHAAPPPSGPGVAPPPVLQPSAWKVANSQTRRYACGRDDVPKMIVEVKNWLDTEGFDSQQMNTDDNGVLLQIKKRGSWRDFVGMATSLNIVFREADGLLTVEIGAGKWIDKAAVGTVSMFILWPLAVTAGFGAWEQMKMPDKIFGFIGNRLAYR